MRFPATRKPIALFAVIALGVAAWYCSRWFRTADSVHKLALDTSWKTPASEIAYVGSAACVECHRAAADSYALTGMAHSAAALDDPALVKSLGDKVLNAPDFPFRYRFEIKGSTSSVIESALDSEGRVIYEQTEVQRFVIGSGNYARTCVVERPGGYLFQSPITWYRSLESWAMSPNYDRVDHRRFTREILEDCAFCHTGRSQHVAGTRNRYDERRPFDEITIGCERCHGPGARHVEFQNSPNTAGGKDEYIVNPGKLDLQLGSDVCLQCHRGGRHGFEVERPGRSWANFRPGMPLSAIVAGFYEVGAPNDSIRGGVHFNGKMSQLERSRCFIASPGKLACLTCHSIHHRPEPSRRVEFHRAACLKCHADRGCRLPEPERRKTQADDSCVACHMPTVTPSDVPHIKITDHRIRKPNDNTPPPAATTSPRQLIARPGQNFEPTEAQRNLGIAYGNHGGETGVGVFHERAVQLLDATKWAFATDTRQRLTHGLSLAALGKYRQAVPVLQEVVKLDDNLEAAHNVLATCSFWTGQKELARVHVARSLEINPYRVDMLLLMAKLEIDANQREKAREIYERVLAVHRGHVEARQGLERLQSSGK